MRTSILRAPFPFALGLVAVVVIGACGSGSPSMGSACNQDGDCAAAGLRCLDSPVYGDGGCTPQGKQCQQSCTSNANCGILGSNYGCFLRCGNTGVCIATH